MSELGLIQVYTGNGKGKTTASLGLAFRACGHGFQVLMLQFMKEDQNYGETKAATCLPGFEIKQVGRNKFVNLAEPEAIDIELAQNGWKLAQQAIVSRHYDLVILDEINVAMACGLISTDEVVRFLTGLTDNRTEIVLTGRYAPDAILDIAHLVTEMKDIKHPFAAGAPARKGIDF
ncbi:MAG: cob(I)yrinic acid a,c-diamide adenosyltransferase [Negativicutes bacterium]|nr:cob(I)yrinic acid a,c-diamide adenosyltransferase [Negativicutes bacterium]